MRINKIELQPYHEVFDKIDSLLKSNKLILVALDGKCGSGKSTFANILNEVYDCNLFHMDDFFLRPELKTDERLNEIGGNVDYTRFKEEVINGILSEKIFTYQIYNCKEMKLTDIRTVHPKKLNIVEGVYSMHPSLVEHYNLKIYVDIEEDEQRKRIYYRNPIMYDRFINEWIPKENQYFDLYKIKEKCDIILKAVSIG